MGWFSRNKEISTLNPLQEGVQSNVAGTINQGMNAGQYTGQLSAPMGQGEMDALGNYNRLAALSGQSLGGMINTDEDAFRQNFATEVADPATRYFKEQYLPLLTEATPTMSTYRGQVTRGAIGDMSDKLLTQRFTAREAMKDRALNAMGMAGQLGTTSMALNAIPREIQQAGLDRAYNEFIGADQRKQGYVNAGLNMLGISTKAQVSEPTAFGDFMKTAGMVSQMVSNFIPGTNPKTVDPTVLEKQQSGVK
jgi:hypothetical protein